MKVLLLAVLAVMVWPSEQKMLPECRDKKVDLAIVLDESGSVNDERWEIMKKFARNIVKRSFINPDAIQVTLVSFAYSVHIHFTLNKYKTTAGILGAIDALKKTEKEGGTSTHLAFNKLKDLLYGKSHGGRSDAIKMVILVQDGISKYMSKTIEAATNLKKAKITIAAVGVANAYQGEMEQIASEPASKYAFRADTFDDLPRLAKKVAAVTCAGYNAFGTCPKGGMDRCCPSNKHSFGGSCYFFGSLLIVDFKTAVKACEEMNAELVTIDSYQEDEFLVQTLDRMVKDKVKVASGYYTGYHYGRGGKWQWISKEEPEYVPNRWYGSYPYSNRAAYGECMVMHKSYRPWKWLQVKCAVKYGLICES